MNALTPAPHAYAVADTDALPELYWDATYAIVLSLIERHPEISAENVGLLQLADLIEHLPNFQDDPSLVTERILLDIQNVWYEETLS